MATLNILHRIYILALTGLLISLSIATALPGKLLPDTLADAPANTLSANRAWCGILMSPSGLDDMNTVTACSNIYFDNESWYEVSNYACGFCMIFAERDCMGENVWWGGPGSFNVEIVKGKSYFCF